MAKDISVDVSTQIHAQQKRPRLLYEFYLDEITLLYAGDKTDVTFPHGGSTVYSAIAIGLDGYQQTAEGQIGRINIKVDNTDKTIGSYVSAYNFQGRKVKVKRVYLDSSGNAPSGSTIFNSLFSGKFEAPKNVTRHFVNLPATSGKPLKRKALLDLYQRDCGNVFGDNKTCNVNGLADLSTLILSSKLAHSGSAVTLCNKTDLSQATDYWNFGSIDIDISGTTYNRKVRDYDYSAEGVTGTIYFDVTLPVSVIANSVFEVKKGCDKKWTTCGSSNAYGPSADNSLNFYGCQHIGTKREST